MNADSLSSLVARVFTIVSFLLLALAVLEGLSNMSGYTLVRGEFAPHQILQYAVVLLMFVVAVVLRQVRDRLPKG